MTPDVQTLVVGAGFAGLSVAQALAPGTVMVIDRGEPFDPVSAAAYLKAHTDGVAAPAVGHFDQRLDETAMQFVSAERGNATPLPLALMSANSYSYRQGGNSNWWGGYAARIGQETFARDGVLAWPLTAADMDPWYRAAEHTLRVHGDPQAIDHSVFGPLPGWDYWREYFAPLFPAARVAPQAKNVTDAEASALGLCKGMGHCAVCAQDAKARPANIFPQVVVHGRTRVERVMFRGSRAVAVDCVSAGEPLRIGFERLIVACGGLENTALLRRSNLPRGTGAGAGRHLQDHAACEVLVALPTPFRRFHLGAEGGVEIPELSGYFGGLGVQALMLPVELQHGQMDSLIATQGQPIPALFWRASALDRLARLYLQLEIPPEWGMELRCRGEATFIHAMPYLANLPRMDAAVLQVLRRIADRGLEIVRVQPYYRHSFGGHHYGGTTAMSRTPAAIVDPDQRLIGTDNVYVSGASVLPRCGPSGPTLSIVALGLRLGARLSTD